MLPPFRKRIGAPHRTSFSKDPLFTTFSVFLKLREFVICVIYLINQLKNTFTQDTWHCSFMASKFAVSIAESFKNIHYENMCELFKSDSSPLKKILVQIWNCLSLHFLIVKVFANFNTWAQDFLFHPLNSKAYFSFITSLRNIANVVLGSINWFSSEKVTLVMCMCIIMMFLFPK